MAHSVPEQLDKLTDRAGPDGNRLRVRTHPLADVDALDAGDLVVQYLLNSGSDDMGVNGAVTPVIFSYAPPANRKLVAGRLLGYLEMAGNFDSVKFGDLAALANGVEIWADGKLIANWQDNVDILTCMYDAEGYDAFAKSTKSMSLRWTFTKAAEGSFKGLDVSSLFSIVIQDDLSAAGIIFRVRIHGILLDI